MFISVIIPIYNQKEFLKECLLSVLSQSGGFKTEIIVVNDGSTDGAEELIKHFSSSFDNIIGLTQGRQGPASARNAGLKVAKGDYITFLDADDILLPNALRILSETSKINNADIAVGEIIRIKSKEGVAYKSRSRKPKTSMVSPWDAIEKTLYQKWFQFAGSLGGKLFKRNLFKHTKFIIGKNYEDLAILPDLYNVGQRIAHVNIPVYGYRNNPQSFTNKWSEKRVDILQILAELRDKPFISINPQLLKALASREFCAACNIIGILDKYKVSHKQIYEQCVKIICKNRREILSNPKVRFKEWLAAFLACGGIKTFILSQRWLKPVS